MVDLIPDVYKVFVCCKCGESYGVDKHNLIHKINGIWVCVNCYPDGKFYCDCC